MTYLRSAKLSGLHTGRVFIALIIIIIIVMNIIYAF